MAVKTNQAVAAAANTEPAVTEEVATEAVVTEREVSDGVVTEGEAPKGDVGDGIVTEGEAPRGDVGDGVVTEGEVTEGEDTNPVVTDPPSTDPPVTVVYEKGKLYALPLGNVQPDPDQPRKFFDQQALAELSASISSHGVLQPILVRTGAEGTFIIVSGERRYQAALKAGLTTIPAILTDGEPAEISIIENLLRENLTAIEEAEAIERLRAGHGYAQIDVAAVLGKSEASISEILSLNRLPEEVKDDCRNDPRVSRKVLAVITRQKSPEKMVTLYTKYKESGLTRGEIIKQPAKPKAARAPMTPEELAAVSERLDMLLAKDLTAEQKAAFLPELSKIRSVAYMKIKVFKQ